MCTKSYTILMVIAMVTNVICGQVVVIDPGHGILTDGKNGDGRTTTEIETSLAVGLILRNLIRENTDWKVYMTRTNNDRGSWISVNKRATMANDWEADVLISIHCNAGGGTGTETFWCDEYAISPTNDQRLAREVQKLSSRHGEWKDRRVTDDISFLNYDLGVLKYSSAPSCLNEIGFVDSSDKDKLLDREWRKKFAMAYFNALKAFL